MKTEKIQYSLSQGWIEGSPEACLRDAQLVLYFGTRSLLEDPSLFRSLTLRYPAAHLVGCSSAGEISGSDICDSSLVAAAIRLEHGRTRVAKARIGGGERGFAAGVSLASELAGDELCGLLVLSDGTGVNGSELVRGITSVVGGTIPVAGGMAADADRFERTLVGCDTRPVPGQAVAVGFYGAAVRMGAGNGGGWEPFGPRRVITRSDGNRLLQVDGRSALDLYRDYLREQAAGLPATALRVPLYLHLPDEGRLGLVRTVIAVEEDTDCMVFAGDLPQGHEVQLMRARRDSLIDGAGEAAWDAAAGVPAAGRLSVLISSVGRKMVLGERAGDEIDAVSDVLGRGAQLGFYSYAEIAPLGRSRQCRIHNQTMTVMALNELA